MLQPRNREIGPLAALPGGAVTNHALALKQAFAMRHFIRSQSGNRILRGSLRKGSAGHRGYCEVTSESQVLAAYHSNVEPVAQPFLAVFLGPSLTRRDCAADGRQRRLVIEDHVAASQRYPQLLPELRQVHTHGRRAHLRI